MPFLEIRLKDIVFDPKVQTYCINSNFICPSYSHSWACPPEAPYLEQQISEFHKFYLIFVEFKLAEYIKKQKLLNLEETESNIRNTLFTKNLHRNKLEEEIKTFVNEQETDYEERLILWDGYCRLCSNKIDKGCTYDSGKPCRYPNDKRYSMEAIGIDVTRTVRNLDFKIEWPPTNVVYRFGLVCYKI
jgi:predicted metal-binding protein